MGAPDHPMPAVRTDWPREALDLLNQAESSLRDGDWAGYGRLLGELRALLEGVNDQRPDSGGQ
jgi:hypothetical protein